MDSSSTTGIDTNTIADTLSTVTQVVQDSVGAVKDSIVETATAVATTVADTASAYTDSVHTLGSVVRDLSSSLSHTEASLHFPMIFGIIGGLAIFLLGMNFMSSGLQTVAGPKLRSLIGSVTNNRFMAAVVGILVTTIVQSSSVTTVMVVGFVNSGIMALTQALGVIFGANIGTTITGWLIALKVGKFGLPMLAIAAFFYLFSKKDRVKYIAMAIMGIGMIFFGLQLMKYGFKPVAKDPSFKYFFSLFQFDLSHGFTFITYLSVLKCVFLGALLTAIVQSSSATLGITMTLAATGAINFETAAALVLGENIGTTITALLASLNANSTAKRAAYGHMLFNLIGVTWITAIFGAYITGVLAVFNHFSDFFITAFGHSSEHHLKGVANAIDPNIGIKIAMVHTGFNIVNTAIFVPLIPVIARFLERVAPDKNTKESAHLTSLGTITMHESPSLAIEEAKLEVDRMAGDLESMNSLLNKLLKSGEYSDNDIKKIFIYEEKMDIYQAEVTTFLMDLLATKELSYESAETIQRLFRFADEYESISDYFTGILKRFLKLKEEDITIGDTEMGDIIEIHGKMTSFLKLINVAVKDCNYDLDPKLVAEASMVKETFKEKRRSHLMRLSEQTVAPLLSVSYMDILTNYRKVNDHLTNISDVLAR